MSDVAIDVCVNAATVTRRISFHFQTVEKLYDVKILARCQILPEG